MRSHEVPIGSDPDLEQRATLSRSESAVEISFEGLVGPTHNFAGLSIGNKASQRNAKSRSSPRRAALAGLEKMERLLDLGLPQGLLLPHRRPNLSALNRLGFRGSPETMCADAWRSDPQLFATLMSASSMWAANSATVSPSMDTSDGKLHLTPANLASMPHRSFEAESAKRQFQIVFGDERHFTIHQPLPGGTFLGDEGAANHVRLALDHGSPGVELFVYNGPGGTSPARQSRRASESVARLHDLEPGRTAYAQQSVRAGDAGVIHNDMICVTNGPMMLVHELAFEDRAAALEEIRRKFERLQLVEVSDDELSLEEAVASYVFNAQLVTLPGGGGMALILPLEVRDHANAVKLVDRLLAGSNPISKAVYVDVSESMRNGGGPACLRLRAVFTPEQLDAVDPRFLLSHPVIDKLKREITTHYRDELTPDALADPNFHKEALQALHAVYEALGVEELLPD